MLINESELRNYVISKYNSIQEIWRDDDPWHMYAYQCINSFVKSYNRHESLNKGIILNAGSGDCQHISLDNIVNVDIATSLLRRIPRSICATIEHLPFKSQTFSTILCVGSVINYCNAAQVISEFSRTSKTNGLLILEYENSSSFEFIFTNNFGKKVVFIETEYNLTNDYLWLFSEKYISSTLNTYGYRIIKRKYFHILSSVMYRIVKNYKHAWKFSALDILLEKIPILRKYSSNIIICCEKC